MSIPRSVRTFFDTLSPQEKYDAAITAQQNNQSLKEVLKIKQQARDYVAEAVNQMDAAAAGAKRDVTLTLQLRVPEGWSDKEAEHFLIDVITEDSDQYVIVRPNWPHEQDDDDAASP
jgi:hypothetical protein